MTEEPADGPWAPGAVVWVKLGSCWWPGTVVDASALPPNALRKLRKSPLAIVQFFQEESYEFVRNESGIFEYTCSRKDEFIKKGLDMYRAKHGHMEKFPEDVIRAEELTGGDVEILTRDRFQEVKKESYAGIFGDGPRRTPITAKRGRQSKSNLSTPKVAPSPIRKVNRGSGNYKAHILVQGHTTAPEQTPAPASSPTPSTAPSTPTSCAPPAASLAPATPASSTPGVYTCHACSFSSTRLNVMIMHTKTHSVTFTPYIQSPKLLKPTKSVKKPSPLKVEAKAKKPRKSSGKAAKRAGGETSAVEPKKSKSVVEIKNTLLADWEDGDESSMDEPLSSVAVVERRESKESSGESETAIETTELSDKSNGTNDVTKDTKDLQELTQDIEANAKVTKEIPNDIEESLKEPADSPEKASCFDFQEDEELPIDSARKMTRVKKTEVRKVEPETDTSDDVAKEVAELLEKTTVPELPSAPPTVKFQENFPEVEKAKSPDKTDVSLPSEVPQHKVIFKTKTFFRSRHSRSQDAIEKYVAEQLTSVGLDTEAEGGTSDTAPSPPAAPSPPLVPPLDAVKSARLAPKIQLKKMKAEAQLREKLNESPPNKNIDITDILMKEDNHNSKIDTESIDAITEVEIKSSELEKFDKSPENAKNYVDALPDDEKSMCEILPESFACSHSEVSASTSSIEKDNDEKTGSEVMPTADSNLEANALLLPANTIPAHDELSVLSPEAEIPESTSLAADSTETESVQGKLSESTASAVDALLSVSKNADRLTKHIGEDPPEDLFEDDSKFYDSSEQVNGIEPESDDFNLNGGSYENEIVSEHVNNEQDKIEGQFAVGMTYNKENDTKATFESDCTDKKIPSKKSVQKTSILSKILVGETQFSSSDSRDESFSMNMKTNPEVSSQMLLTNFSLDTDTTETPLTRLKNNNEIKTSVEIQKSVDERVTQTYHINNNLEIPESVTESDLQIAQTLISLPGTALGLNSESILIQKSESSNNFDLCNLDLLDQNLHQKKNAIELKYKTLSANDMNFKKNQLCPEDIMDFSETEAEKNLNFNAAQSLVEMSKSIEHNVLTNELQPDETIKVNDSKISPINHVREKQTVETEMAFLTNTDISEPVTSNETTTIKSTYESTPSKLLQILEEPPRTKPLLRMVSPKMVPLTKDKILNFGVNKTSSSKLLTSPQKQKIIIRRTAPPSKTALSTLMETAQDKIVLSRSTKAPSKDGVSTYTIETSPDPKPEAKILIQQKVKKITRSPPRLLQKVKPQTTFITSTGTLIQQSSGASITDLKPTKTLIMGTHVQHNPLVPNKEVKQKILMTSTVMQQNPGVSNADLKSQKSSVLGILKQQSPNTDIKLQKTLITGNVLQQKPSLSRSESNPQTTLITSTGNLIQQNQVMEDVFDINSMPIVLSDDLLTPEIIEKMPVVLSDGAAGKLVSPSPLKQTAKQIVKPDLKPITSEIEKKAIFKPTTIKPESASKTILMAPLPEKSATPNILSKTPKMRGKPMLLFDKVTGQQKIIVTNTDPNSKDIKVSGATHTIPQATGKPEKFIILPANASPRPGRTQKIVIGPQPGKTQILVSSKPAESSPMKTIINKPGASKPLAPEVVNPGGTVMIITNAQGGQSRIVLTPEHEKLLFPNKSLQAPPKITPRSIAPSSVVASKQQIIVTSAAPPMVRTVTKPQPRIITKQKQQQHAIITSKGQLIVPGGSKPASTIARSTLTSDVRPATTMRTFAPAPSKIIRSPAPRPQQPKEPVIILQQKSGAVMQLTPAQFEHLQRTGQIVQKSQATKSVVSQRPVMQKQMLLVPTEEIPTPRVVQKQKPKVARPSCSSPAPKKPRLAERPTPVSEHPVPPLISTVTTLALPPAPIALPVLLPPPAAPVLTPDSQQNNFADLDNLEELLPSTAIARPAPDIPPPPPPPVLSSQPPEPQHLPIPDNQLLAVPGENFGGPPNSFYLCVEENGTLTPIDNRPLILENNQLVPMAIEDPGIMLGLVGGEGQLVLGESTMPEIPQPERRDILAAALANTDVFRPEAPREDLAPDFRDLNASVSVHSRVSETSMTLNQPIMTPLEVPTHTDEQPAVASSIEDGLAVIGVTTPNIPTSLELPITVTNPRIAPKTTNPLIVSCSSTFHSTGPLPSPGNFPEYVPHVVGQGSISMPLLTEEDDGIGKSMPILTDEMAMENIASSVELTASSVESVVESGAEQDEDGSQWSRKLQTPGSDSSECSAEIPIQQSLQLSSSDLPTHNGRSHDS